jgi:hypothetical protein
MHVYLRDEPVRLDMREVDAEGMAPEGSELVPVAFFVRGNEHPSFRALLPPDTLEVLEEALVEPVTLGVLAEEPEDPSGEVHAMVGLAIPVDAQELEGGELEGAGSAEPPAEPWRESVGDPDAWRGSDDFEEESAAPTPTALLAFAPLIRLQRKFPADFADELADLLESALSGATRSAIQARVDRMLGDL